MDAKSFEHCLAVLIYTGACSAHQQHSTPSGKGDMGEAEFHLGNQRRYRPEELEVALKNSKELSLEC